MSVVHLPSVLSVFLGRQTAYFLTGCFRVNDAITLSCGIIECSILLRIFYFLFIENLHWKWSMILASLKLWGIFVCWGGLESYIQWFINFFVADSEMSFGGIGSFDRTTHVVWHLPSFYIYWSCLFVYASIEVVYSYTG